MKITLCGSARFEDEFHKWNEALTLSGHIVYSLAVYPSTKRGVKNWYNKTQKDALDKAHLGKIDNSDAIVVINTGGYIGESTSREMRHASVSKIVYYTCPMGVNTRLSYKLLKNGINI